MMRVTIRYWNYYFMRQHLSGYKMQTQCRVSSLSLWDRETLNLRKCFLKYWQKKENVTFEKSFCRSSHWCCHDRIMTWQESLTYKRIPLHRRFLCWVWMRICWGYRSIYTKYGSYSQRSRRKRYSYHHKVRMTLRPRSPKWKNPEVCVLWVIYVSLMWRNARKKFLRNRVSICQESEI